MMDVNFWAVLVAALASMVIGSLWYGFLFGKKFEAIMGFDKLTPEQQNAAKKGMSKSYVTQLIASLVMFYVFAVLASKLGANTVAEGLNVAFWTWIGFIVPVKLGDAIWGGKMPLFWLSIGNFLLTLLVAGAIIGGWQ